LQNRTKHFTIAVEDIFQMHNTSAVMRSCEIFGIQELNVIEQRYGEKYRQGNCDGRSKIDINTFDSITNCQIQKSKGYQIIATTPHENDCLLEDFDISKPVLYFLEQRETDYLKKFCNAPMVF
jgi:tRNA (guanosine-2'-O-)-methyltransferase